MFALEAVCKVWTNSLEANCLSTFLLLLLDCLPAKSVWARYAKTKIPNRLNEQAMEAYQRFTAARKTGGRQRTTNLRQVLNAILYVTKTGIQWRMLPHDFPPHNTVYGYFWQWRNAGVWQRVHDTLRAQVRQQAGRHKHPMAGCLDSQSVKTTPGAWRARL